MLLSYAKNFQWTSQKNPTTHSLSILVGKTCVSLIQLNSCNNSSFREESIKPSTAGAESHPAGQPAETEDLLQDCWSRCVNVTEMWLINSSWVWELYFPWAHHCRCYLFNFILHRKSLPVWRHLKTFFSLVLQPDVELLEVKQQDTGRRLHKHLISVLVFLMWSSLCKCR